MAQPPNYRQATGPKTCANCSAFTKAGWCKMFKRGVAGGMTCNDWQAK